jgi:nucleotide-binding universal stress UspA family protein
MHEVILTCVDGSPGGYAAVAEAAELARRFNARLIALSVEEGLPRYASIMGEVDEFKREKDAYFETVGHEAARIAGEHGAKLTHETRLGHAADAIVRFVEEVGADLVVLGPHRQAHHAARGSRGCMDARAPTLTMRTGLLGVRANVPKWDSGRRAEEPKSAVWLKSKRPCS